MIVWTNERVAIWLTSLDIINPNLSLDQSGLHGAAIALDADMDTPTLAMMLQIPNSSVEARYNSEFWLDRIVCGLIFIRLPFFRCKSKLCRYLYFKRSYFGWSIIYN